MDWTASRVRATDGIELAVFEAGPRDAATVLLVHGYPDDHHVWDAVAAELALRFHVLTYDVRGAGESGRPGTRKAYRLDQLAADVVTVAGDAAVHLVGHDWGSIQGWHAVTRPEARFASYTSISGPHLPYAGAWLRWARRADRGAAMRQVRASWYIGLFRLPVLPNLLWNSGLGHRLIGHRLMGSTASAASRADAVRGLELYRANMSGSSRPTRCSVPTMVLAPSADRYVTVPLSTGSPVRWTDDLRTQVIEGGHWTMVRHPQRITEPLTAFIDELSTR